MEPEAINCGPANYQRAFYTPEVKAVNERESEVTHIITTASLDRQGDVVEPGGADVANFLRNPVVLADHDYSIHSIIGRASKLEISKEGITATTTFAKTDLGQQAFALVQSGMARGWSIGFRPIEHESIKDEKGNLKGFRFKKWELLEYSLVAIPANPDAVMNAIKSGVISAKHKDIFFRTVTGLVQPGDSTPAPTKANAAKKREMSPLEQRLSKIKRRADRRARGQAYLAMRASDD